MKETFALVGGVLAVINPAQYNAGIACIEALLEQPEKVAKREFLAELLNIWTMPYNAMSLMSNQNSPLHWDNGGAYTSMDLLLSVRDYANGRFFAPGLSFEFWYRPGTVIVLVGRVLRHGATAEGERFCVALYMRESVLKDLGIPEPEWMRIRANSIIV